MNQIRRKILFDTNVFVCIANGIIDKDKLERIRHIICKNHISCASALSVFELVQGIHEPNREQFIHCRNAVRAMLDLCQEMLAEPEWYIKKNLVIPLKCEPLVDPSETIAACRHIAQSETLDQALSWREVKQKDGKIILERLRIEDARVIHQEARSRYLAGMLAVRNNLIPDAEKRKINGKLVRMRKNEMRERVIQQIESEYFLFHYYGTELSHYGVQLVGAITDWDRDAVERLQPNIFAIRHNLMAMLKDGYNVSSENNKGDCFDSLFLVYLIEPDIEFVTMDMRLVQILRSEGIESRVWSLDDYLDGRCP